MHQIRIPIRTTCAALSALAVSASLAGAQSFTRITTGPHVTDSGGSRAVVWADFDGNGTLDLFVTNGPTAGENNDLYLNSGAPNFTFTKVVGDPIVSDGAKSDGATVGDVDNDGDLDVAVVNWYGDNNLFYLNNGNGSFTQVTTGPVVNDGGHSETASFGDYDRDGRLDLYVTNSGPSLATAEANFLYRNEGAATFARALAGAQSSDIFLSRGVNWIDYDLDGDEDIFITNESNQNENLYRNELVESGLPTFTAITGVTPVIGSSQSFSGAWADYDNDRDLDLVVINSGAQNEQLYRNDGGSFTAVTGDPLVTAGGWSVSGDWGDVDNDGDLDLFITNAFGGGTKRNFLFMNQWAETGTASFVRVTTGAIVNDLGWSYGSAFGDYDEDGDLDLYVAKTVNDNETNAHYRNDNANGNHWLELRLRGVASNRSAIGAKVRVKAVIAGNPVWLTRLVQGQNAYCGQNLDLHFGLGSSSAADSLVVEWPSGAVDVLTGFSADRRVTIQEGGVVSSTDSGAVIGAPASGRPRIESFAAPNPFGETTTIHLRSSGADRVALSLFDAGGRLLEQRDLPPGEGWQQVRLAPEGDGSVYFYRLRGASAETEGKLVRRRSSR